MTSCPILGALCVGIEEYSCPELLDLPGARRDAERFADFLHGRALPEEKIYLLVGKVTKGELETCISQFMELIRSSSTGAARHLVAVFVAAHGRQPDSCELPAILASDAKCPESEDGLVHLDHHLLLPFDSMRRQKLKVWLVIDTCRENGAIGTWTGNEQTRARRALWHSDTDFHIVLACDRGRFASDDQSLADALIDSLDDPDKDLEAASIEAQNRIAASSCKRQRPWRNSRGDFSNILLPEPKVEALCMPLRLVQWLMFATGVLAAIIVTLLFGILLRSIDMRCTVISGRHSAGCPGNSCFCTDCDPCNMYLAERDWEWKHFGCSILGLPLNRCWLAFSLNLWWLGATSRLGWLTLRACQRDRGQLVPVVIACSLSATSAISLWQTFLSQSAKLIVNSLKYNVINTCLLASSMSIVLRLSSLQPEQPCCGRAFDMLSRQFLRSFWPTAVLGELCVMLLTRSTESFEEFIEQENKFYLLYLMLGLLFSWVAWRLALGISSKYSSNQGFKLKGVVWQLLIVKTVWCTCRCLHWLLTCHNLGTLTNKYNLAMVLIERLAVLEILRLIKHFSTLYAQLKQVPFLVDIRPLDE